MRPAYWIGVMALVGAIAGYAIEKLTGWLDTGIGTAVGVLVGVLIYTRLTDRSSAQ